MGAWFATFLNKNGYRVIVYDKNKPAARNLSRKRGFQFISDQSQAVRLAQLVIVATPTQVTQRILGQIEHHISHGTLVVEISSIKEPVRRKLQEMRTRGVPILSIHPMFGPGIKTPAGKTVITASLPVGNAFAKKFLSSLRKAGAKIIHTDFDHHDKLVSMTLALPHFINIAMVNTLRATGTNPNLLRRIAGTTFKLQLLTAQAIYHEDFGNEVSILMDSKQSLKALKRFAQESTVTLNIIKKGDRNGLIRNLHADRNFLQKDKLFASANRRFNAAVEASSPR